MIEVRTQAGVNVVEAPIEVISTEKVLVRVQPGSLWAELAQDGRQVGAVIHGPAEYAFDAIVETEEGALGKSFRGEIEEYKIYMGGTDLQAQSGTASQEELLARGFPSAEAFINGAGESLGLHNIRNDGHISSAGGPGEGVVLWSDDGVKKNVITAKGRSQVLVKDKTVYTLSDDNYVMVDDGRVSIKGPGGKRLLIDRGEILEPGELRDLGPRIAREVKDAMRDLKFSTRRRREGDLW